MTHRFAPRPEPPYYAVIFTSQRTDVDGGYGAMAALSMYFPNISAVFITALVLLLLCRAY